MNPWRLNPQQGILSADGDTLVFTEGLARVGSIAPSQVKQGGASSGDVLTWDGSAWGPDAPSGGGGVLWTLTGGGSGTTSWTSTINGGASGSEYAPYQVLRGGDSSAF